MKWDRISERLTEIESWARDGHSEKEIFIMLGLSSATWQRYKRDHKELKDALNRGYEFSLPKVIPALFKSAIGYQYNEVTQERDKNGNLITTKIVTKEVQPNVSAIMNILKNKFPNEWNTVEKLDITTTTTSKIPDMPSEFISKLAEELLNSEAGEDDDKNL